jgi:methylenetetrahydrofolate dehydrogenase (NADP+)/methenyltetrahydrofolate cyclohydrolase
MIIDGKAISKQILEELKAEILAFKSKKIIPGLAVVVVGSYPASKIYIKNKQKICEEVGIYFEKHELLENTSQFEIIKLINNLNKNKKIHGILTQLPLPPHIDAKLIAEKIIPPKDVDVFNAANIGKLINESAILMPCTPSGIIEMLKREKLKIQGQHAVIVGRSNIVGKPLSLMLLNENATVTICHRKTKNIKSHCKSADILIAAAGSPKLITANMVKNGAVVIDVGINRTNDGKICGDVDFENVKKIASYITPVPNGVGPMTIAMLVRNTVIAARLQNS